MRPRDPAADLSSWLFEACVQVYRCPLSGLRQAPPPQTLPLPLIPTPHTYWSRPKSKRGLERALFGLQYVLVDPSYRGITPPACRIPARHGGDRKQPGFGPYHRLPAQRSTRCVFRSRSFSSNDDSTQPNETDYGYPTHVSAVIFPAQYSTVQSTLRPSCCVKNCLWKQR